MEFRTVGEFVGGPYDGMKLTFDTSNGWAEPPGSMAVDQGCAHMDMDGTKLIFTPYSYSERMRYVGSDWFVVIDDELREFYNLVHNDGEDRLALAETVDDRVLITGRYTWESV